MLPETHALDLISEVRLKIGNVTHVIDIEELKSIRELRQKRIQSLNHAIDCASINLDDEHLHERLYAVRRELSSIIECI